MSGHNSMMLTVDDLILTCDKCSGTGLPPQPVQTPGGFGVRVVAVYGQCDRCFGKGKVMTESGKAILALIHHHNSGGV